VVLETFLGASSGEGICSNLRSAPVSPGRNRKTALKPSLDPVHFERFWVSIFRYHLDIKASSVESVCKKVGFWLGIEKEAAEFAASGIKLALAAPRR
jgi:hypothetical protein